MQVKAITKGFYANRLRPEGAVFDIKSKDDLGSWMQPIATENGPTVTQLKERLKEMGVEFEPKAVKADLQALLDVALEDAGNEPLV